MRRSLLAVALVCVVGLVGCGDDDEEEAATTETTTATTAPATPGRGGRFCELLRSYEDKYNRTRNVSEPEQLRDLVRSLPDDLEEAQEVAPLEVRGDVELVAQVIDEYVRELEKVDFQTNRIPAGMVQRLLSSDFLAAAQRLQAYGRANC
ncbi:MAG TPA: hypothetical protein VHF24_08360 [Acidimicrobiales bacterium]|jgi:hypothetical protein|nr:hypothetical protein [Acidimicrobiales bacterium]